MSSAVDLVSSLILEDGRRWGEAATEWQIEDAKAIVNSDHRYFYLTRPRGGSKTSDLAAVALAVLLEQMPAAASGHCFAADKDQAGLLLDAATGFVRRTPGLDRHIHIGSNQLINRHGGAAVNIYSSDSASAYGLRSHLLIIDEFSMWPAVRNSESLWQAIFSTVPKVPDSRLVILSTAGDPSSLAGQVIEQARTDPAWHVNEIPGPLEWLHPSELEQQERLLPEVAKRRLIYNEWVAGDDQLATLENIQALVQLSGPQPPKKGRRYRIGLDLGLVRDRTAASITHREGNVVVLDRLEVWKGTRRRPVRLDTIETWLEETSRNYNRAPIHFDPHQAAHLTQRLRSRGIKAHEHTFSLASNHELATSLDQAIRTGTLHIYQHDELIDELATVILKETGPNRFKIDTVGQGHDDMVVAVALGVYAHQHRRQAHTLDGKAIAWANAGFISQSHWQLR